MVRFICDCWLVLCGVWCVANAHFASALVGTSNREELYWLSPKNTRVRAILAWILFGTKQEVCIPWRNIFKEGEKECVVVTWE